jgi:putative DNA primase/helicase
MNTHHSLPASIRSIDERAEHELALVQRAASSAPPIIKVVKSSKAGDVPRVILTRGSDVQPVAVDWLWDGWLAAGKLHLIGGAPGTGKTTIAATLAATITSGGRWPDGSRAAPGSAVIWSGEDDSADTLIPRLRAAGAGMDRVHMVEGVREGGECYPFDPARDMDALRAELVNISDVRLIVIDPIVSAISKDSHNNGDVRRGLQPLVDLGMQLGAAVLGVTHFSKGTSGREPVERITGSLAFGALARMVMVTAKQEADGDRQERRVMLRAKSNIGPDGGGFVYDLQQGELSGYPGIEVSSVLWGESIYGTARELLAEAEQHDDDHGSDAASFLRDLLAYGACAAKDIYKEAESAGYSRDTMKRAKSRIGVKAVKQGMQGGWVWQLPHIEGSRASTEGCEESTQIDPLPSLPSADMPPPSGAEMEVISV